MNILKFPGLNTTLVITRGIIAGGLTLAESFDAQIKKLQQQSHHFQSQGRQEISIGADGDIAAIEIENQLSRGQETLWQYQLACQLPESGAATAAGAAGKMLALSYVKLDGDFQGNAELTTQVLAHEVGHAMYAYTPDYSSRENYIRGTLADEGMATINSIRVRQEIRGAGGPDIGISGAYTSTDRDFYSRTYHDLESGNMDIETARDVIGETYRHKTTSNTGQTYENYYGCWYDKNIARKENPECPK